MARLIVVRQRGNRQTPPASLPDIPSPSLAALVISTSQINLTATYVGPPTLATYTFQRAPSVAGVPGTWITLATQAGATFSDTGLSANTQYFYRVNIQTTETPSRNSVWAGTSAVTNSGGAVAAPFPRLAAHANKVTTLNFDNLSWRTFATYMNQVVMGAWDGWDAGKSMTFAQVTNWIKTNSVAPKGTKVFQYYNTYHISTTIANQSVFVANNWLVRNSYPSGTLTVNGAGYNIANITAGGPTDGAGRTCQQYTPDYIADWQYNGGVANLDIFTNAANPNLDGTWFDDLTFESQDGGDFNRDGTNDADSAACSAAIRAGFKAVWQRFASNKPGKIIQANLSQIANHATPAEAAELAGIVAGGGMEGMLGVSWAPENFGGGWQGMMANYIREMAFATDPEQVYFMHSCLSNTGKDPFRNTTAYQAVRYGLASCLMFDAAYCPCPNGATDAPSGSNFYDGLYLVGWWADEFSVQPGTNQVLAYASAAPGLGWMGDAVDNGPITIPDANGLLVRRFRRRSNGKFVYAVLNPRGNPATTWTAPVNVQALQGIRETTVNNGAAHTLGTVLAIPASDARFWLQT